MAHTLDSLIAALTQARIDAGTDVPLVVVGAGSEFSVTGVVVEREGAPPNQTTRIVLEE